MNALFKKTITPCLGTYSGKHIWEKHTGQYISESDFTVAMVDAGFKYNPAKGKLCCQVAQKLIPVGNSLGKTI
jgi:hypothetical protein